MNPAASGRSAAIDGILLLDKPAGVTSNGALQRVKRLLRARKAGHTGSLDPAATGMLPLCFGEATKVSAFLLDADKTYRVTARLGRSTDTGDAEGQETAIKPVPALDAAAWASILDGFLGESRQVPPMYSALKKDGKRLYELARKGETVEREARPITVHAMDLLEAAGTRLVFRVRCSKGTYVRTLVEDVAARAGTVAYTRSLHRESVGDFDPRAMLDMEAIAALAGEGPGVLAAHLLPPDRGLSGFPAVEVDSDAAGRLRHGMTVRASAASATGLVRLYGPGEPPEFIGIGERSDAGEVAPKRIFGGG